MKNFRLFIFTASCFVLAASLFFVAKQNTEHKSIATNASVHKDYIKWVDFTVTKYAMNAALQYDIESYEQENHLNWIEMLAYYAAKTGGNFSNTKNIKQKFSEIAEITKKQNISIKTLAKDLKYYNYYYQAYNAILGGMCGKYKIQCEDSSPKKWETKYGLKAYSPIAAGFYYNDYDDFGVSRSYGFQRKHLGHDMMSCTGTPVIAIESGYVEALGWNRYGGWRIGIRSFDRKRYYYYAHLRKDHPFTPSLKEGSIVTAGNVIGYVGRTGYSTKENTNNIDTSHLHFGIQLIFDECQKEGNNEIWIDCYELTKFLYQNRSITVKTADDKDSECAFKMKDPAVENYKKQIAKRKKKFFNFNFTK